MIKLNIASGPNVFTNGWINYDIVDVSRYLDFLKAAPFDGMPEQQKMLATKIKKHGVDFRVHDLNKGFPQHLSNSVDLIYGGQMIEHLNPVYQTPLFLKECYRMLKPGGILRLTTPDLDLLIHAYLNNEMNQFNKEQPDFFQSADSSSQLAYLMFGASGPDCTATKYEGHFFLFTKKSMTSFLQKVGFSDIAFHCEGKSKNLVMSNEIVDAGMSHSFAVEAIK